MNFSGSGSWEQSNSRPPFCPMNSPRSRSRVRIWRLHYGDDGKLIGCAQARALPHSILLGPTLATLIRSRQNSKSTKSDAIGTWRKTSIVSLDYEVWDSTGKVAIGLFAASKVWRLGAADEFPIVTIMEAPNAVPETPEQLSNSPPRDVRVVNLLAWPRLV